MRMNLKIRVNEKEIEVKAVLDDCSFYTILNAYPETKEELEKYEWFSLDKGDEIIRGRFIKGKIYFNDKLTTENIIFDKKCRKNIIGWHQLKDMGLLKVNPNRKHVVDVPPVLIDGQAKPGYAREKHLKYHLIGDAKRVIASWVRKGIIERTSSVCNSPVTLTTKSNGKVKIIFDYFDLNSCVTEKSSEQNRNKVIGRVPLGQFYSVIKLYYGEWQIPLDTNTKYKTAFTFLGQQYVWNRLPGKFRNSTAIRGHTLDLILGKLPQSVRKHVTYYVDKMLISSDTKEECHQFTELLFNHLQDNGFEMQETDNQICQPLVEYLGRKISPEGIGLHPNYIQKVLQIKPPRNKYNLKSILATLEDARRFTPGFALFAADLYTLLNKNEQWFWDNKRQEELDQLKCQILKKRLVVPLQTEEQPCIVEIFIINNTWMAEVSNGVRKPYCSLSSTIKPVKQQETLAVKELKAMNKAWKKIKGELEGRVITWEVESPEVACYKEDPSSVKVNKKIDLSFLDSPKHKIKEVPSSGRKLPIEWPYHV